MNEDVDRITDFVDQELESTLAFLERLVNQPSIEGSIAIEHCLAIVADQVGLLGGRHSRPTFDGLSSLVCEWGANDEKGRLLLVAHADVVAAEGNWNSSPFSLVRRKASLIGRGVCDMKGGLAAFVGALKVVERFGALRETPVSLVVTGDEEVGSARGMIPLLREGLVTGKWAICGEPTSLKIFTGNRGVIWLRVEVEGKGGHAGMAHTLENPVVGAALIIQALNALPLEAYDERFDPPTPSLTVTSMYPNGPPVANTVPDSVTIAVDRRLLPGEIPEIVVSDIERAISGIASENISARVLVDWTQPAYVCNSSDSLVFIMQSIVRTVGRDDLLGTDPAVDDSSWLGSAGISTILYGPGAPDQAHATNETVLIAEVRDAIEIYARLILAASNRRL